MRPVSDKTAARNRRYAGERREFLEGRPGCEAGHPVHCSGQATEVHHMAGRGVLVFFDRSRWLAVCRGCHAWITEHPREAVDRGWSVRRNGAG